MTTAGSRLGSPGDRGHEPEHVAPARWLPESGVREERAARTLTTIGVRDLDAENPIFAVVRKDGYLGAASRALLESLKSGAFYGST